MRFMMIMVQNSRESNHVAASTASHVDWWKRALCSKAAS